MNLLDRNPTLAQDFALKIEQRIAGAIPAGKTYDQALATAKWFKLEIWASHRYPTEDSRIDGLQHACIRLCQGDKDAGRDLAEAAVWL